jgi:hypothetical protein
LSKIGPCRECRVAGSLGGPGEDRGLRCRELFGEEARQAERFILENAEGQYLANSYARLLTLLSAVSEETSEPPQAIVEYAVRWAAESGDRA